jgi:hypothetical protein
VTVSDAEGLSYYSDEAINRILCMKFGVLKSSRKELKEAGLIAYKRPLYQVLSLDRPMFATLQSPKRSGAGASVSIRDVFAQIAGGER